MSRTPIKRPESASGESSFKATVTAQKAVSGPKCVSCGATTTPLWRRNEMGATVCNACGASFAGTNGSASFLALFIGLQAKARRSPKAATAPGVGPLSCANCHTTTTPLWRRDDAGNNICNACGLYQKLHGSRRPVTMKKAVIKRRKR
ncbi:glucocorticoid receptor-like (DNA-binding domain), partial [Calocera viscosa TUFC12733]